MSKYKIKHRKHIAKNELLDEKQQNPLKMTIPDYSSPLNEIIIYLHDPFKSFVPRNSVN
jgi:hypothetical protein